ncbi:MAG: hypothetical protein M1826_005029 [Phylliscum demangeonii]|nr:MAG: hypothetical protein M1826_005029 [Phylliscum demangeonii]
MGKECEAVYEGKLRALMLVHNGGKPGLPEDITKISHSSGLLVEELWKCIRRIPRYCSGRWPNLLDADTEADLQGSVDKDFAVCVEDAGAGRGRFQPNRGAFAFANHHATVHATPGHASPLQSKAGLLAPFKLEPSMHQHQHQHQQHNLGANLVRAWSRGTGQMKSSLLHFTGLAGSAAREGKMKEILLQYAHE